MRLPGALHVKGMRVGRGMKKTFVPVLASWG